MTPFEDIPRPSLWKRFLLGAALVVFATASATSVAAFREVDKVVDALRPGKGDLRLGQDLSETDPGKPQTIMLLGSDKRPANAKDGGAGAGGRSDTIILVRLDPDKNATALMSLPRDLKVQIPGHGTDKINAAYELGGPRLTLKTVKLATGLSINHVINVDFQGFRRAIDALGCIYADIDRRYFNDSPGYAYIDVQSGYQKLCGEEALEYARFRHEDSDLVRGIRQQDLLRAAKQQVGVGKLVKDRTKLLNIFGKYTTSDRGLKDRGEILRLLKLAVFSVDQPIREVHFEGQITAGNERTGLASFVTASNATVKKLTNQFLGVEQSQGPRGELLPKDRKKRKQAKKQQGDGGLEKAPGPGNDQAIQAIQQGAGGQLPVYFPTVRVKGSLFAGPPRYYKIATPEGKHHKSYRMVAEARPRGRVLRDTGHDLEVAADPRRQVGGEEDRQAHVRAALRRRPPAARGLADQQGRVLGLQHAAPDPDRAADARHRPLDPTSVGSRPSMAQGKEPIGVIGAGWVGLCTAACFAELGHEVVARDILPEKVESLSRGEVPMHEPGLPELLTKNAGRLTFTTDMSAVLDHAGLLFCCVDTPPTYSGDADLSRVEAVVDELGDSTDHAIVMKSTVPVGTGRSIQRRRGALGYVSNPEFLKEGSAVQDFMHPDRVVVGAGEHSGDFAERVAALYEPLGGPIVRTDVASAEMIKLASNAFLATKISFINEIANVSEELGADVSEVARGMGLDERIGEKFLKAGIGYGGSCFPKDVSALKQLAGNSGYHFQLLTAVIEVNELQKRRTVGKLQKHLGSLVGREIAMLGVAFKPDTDDIREATSLVLAARLQGEGANVRVYDPVAGDSAAEMLGGARVCASALEALDGADGAVLVTEWPEFAELDWAGEVKEAMAQHVVVDGRNFLDREALRAAGFTYEGIGR